MTYIPENGEYPTLSVVHFPCPWCRTVLTIDKFPFMAFRFDRLDIECGCGATLDEVARAVQSDGWPALLAALHWGGSTLFHPRGRFARERWTTA